MTVAQSGTSSSFASQTWNAALNCLALSTYVAAIQVSTVLVVVAAYRLIAVSLWDLIGLFLVVFLVVLTVSPISWGDHPLLLEFVKFTCRRSAAYFPVTVVVEDEDLLKAGRSYLLGFEPHSALPLGIPIVFATNSPLAPKALQGKVHGVASSICFSVPLVRQLWWAIGLRPVSKSLMGELLESGHSVVLCPGGVQECLYMEHGSETAFLRKRHGFVRLAMAHGAPLVPVFALGQSETYNWWRPGPAQLVRDLSRRMGAVPMVLWGVWGTPLPKAHPLRVVVGKPIEVPHTSSPSPEVVQQYLDKFITELQALFEKHKSAYGTSSMELRIM